jgi:hypothetical protein
MDNPESLVNIGTQDIRMDNPESLVNIGTQDIRMDNPESLVTLAHKTKEWTIQSHW